MLFKMLNLGVIILTCILPPAMPSQYYHDLKFKIYKYGQYQDSTERMWYMMRTYMEDGILRTDELNHIRWEHEDTPAYQMGYMMGELMDRYKRIIEEVRRVHFNTKLDQPHYDNTVLQLVRRVENIQKLYMEVFHFVRMILEMPKKFTYKVVAPKFDIIQMKETVDLELAKKHAEALKSKRDERQKQLRKEKRPGYKGTTLGPGNMNSKPYNMWWPRDYGWELDAYGW